MKYLATSMLMLISLVSSAPVDDIGNDYGDTGDDRSYAFKYSAGDSYREETAEANGDGRGVYAFLSPDGGKHTVNYVFGKKVGFLTSVGPTGDLVTSRLAVPELRPVFRAAPVVDAYEWSYTKNDDGSYKFYYNTGNIEHSQTADKDNQVVGSYSYTGQSGTKHNVACESGVQGFLPTYRK